MEANGGGGDPAGGGGRVNDDDLFGQVRAVYEEFVAADAEAGIIRPGAVVGALLDIGSLEQHEPTLIRGVYGTFTEEAAAAFLHECERLEIPRDDIYTPVQPTWAEFQRAGGTAEIAAACYSSVERGSERRLSLIMGVLRG